MVIQVKKEDFVKEHQVNLLRELEKFFVGKKIMKIPTTSIFNGNVYVIQAFNQYLRVLLNSGVNLILIK